MFWLKSSILILVSITFISGCSIIVAVIASTYDEPTSLVVTIESDPPGAEVYLNEKKLGTAPLKVTIEGLSKKHTIVFIKNGYQTKIETVSISPGRKADKRYLSVIRPDGTSFQLGDKTLNVVLEKEEISP
ncbi:MAG: PEGA domain-containing protein [Desulfobacterales bacterium]|jgi:hypothetical protein